MPKRDKGPKTKFPAKINPLEGYLIEESVRDGQGPDPATQAQIDLLNAEDEEMAEGPPKTAAAPVKTRKLAAKSAKSRGKKKR